jgi:hypothetical protein
MAPDQSKYNRTSEPWHEVCLDARAITAKSSTRVTVERIRGDGIEIHSHTMINPRTKLMISITLPEEFVFYGVVIWTLGEFSNNQWSYKSGIETDSICFKNASADTPEEKKDLVKGILPRIRAMGTGPDFPIKMYA